MRCDLIALQAALLRQEEITYDGPKRIHVDEERIVTPNAIEFDERRVGANLRQSGSQLTLLVQREQNVGADSDDERLLEFETLESGLQ